MQRQIKAEETVQIIFINFHTRNESNYELAPFVFYLGEKIVKYVLLDNKIVKIKSLFCLFVNFFSRS